MMAEAALGTPPPPPHLGLEAMNGEGQVVSWQECLQLPWVLEEVRCTGMEFWQPQSRRVSLWVWWREQIFAHLGAYSVIHTASRVCRAWRKSAISVLLWRYPLILNLTVSPASTAEVDDAPDIQIDNTLVITKTVSLETSSVIIANVCTNPPFLLNFSTSRVVSIIRTLVVDLLRKRTGVCRLDRIPRCERKKKKTSLLACDWAVMSCEKGKAFFFCLGGGGEGQRGGGKK